MNEKLKDTTIDLLLDGVKTKIEDVKENYKWQKLFVSTGSFCVNNPDTLTMFEQDLFLVFSKDNLKQMAKKLKDKRGYEFPQLLHRELYDLMVRYEIPAMEAETYIHHFIQVIINYLEENDPDKTLEIFLGDLKKEIEKYFFALESKLELVLNQIADLKEEKVLSYSITDIDIQIRRESKYKGMGLDFFKLDDEQFESRFQSVINDERIYVVGKSREETTYRLLNELRQKNSDRVTLIIKSEEEWNKLQKANVSGNILVPFFYAEKIVAIPNNTNIFVYEIYRHRYYHDADWSISEEMLCKYESTMNEIVLSDKVYEYLYIFSPVYEFPLLHPVPFSREECKDLREKNHILREEEIKTRFKEFKEKKYSLEKLIKLAVKEEHSILGEVLAQFYCDGLFNEKLFILLMELDEEGKDVYDYVRYLHRNGSVDLNEVIGMVKKLSNNKNLLMNLITLEFIEDDDNALIAKEDEEIKKMYWSRNIRLRISDKAEHKVFMWALDECKKYGSLHTYLELLYDIRDKISFQELYNAIFAISNLKGDVASSMTDYYLEEILKELQEAFIMDDEKCAELATLEWMCRNVLEWEQMKCMQKIMKNDPTFYAQLVRIIYKADDDDPSDKKKRELANKMYSGFDKAKFCPTEKDGKVSYENLKNWIEKFKELLVSQKQERLFGNLVGRLLAYSPIGEDGYSPCEAVRKIIEEYHSDSLKTSAGKNIHNNQCCHSPIRILEPIRSNDMKNLIQQIINHSCIISVKISPPHINRYTC